MFHRNPEYIHTLVTQSNPTVKVNWLYGNQLVAEQQYY